MTRGLSWRTFDFILLGAIVLASSFGTVMIRSAVAGNEVLQPLIMRQVYFAILGVVLIFLVGSVDYRYWLALYRPIYLVIMIFLAPQNLQYAPADTPAKRELELPEQKGRSNLLRGQCQSQQQKAHV